MTRHVNSMQRVGVVAWLPIPGACVKVSPDPVVVRRSDPSALLRPMVSRTRPKLQT